MLRGLCCLLVLHSAPSKLRTVWTAQSPERGSCNAGLTSANATKWEIRYGDYCFSQHDLALIGILDRWTCVHEYLQNSDYLHKQGVKSDMWVGAENHRRNKLVLAAVLFTCGSFVCYRGQRGWEFNLHMCAVHNENQNIWVHMVSAECWQHASALGVSQQSLRLLDMVYCSC